MKPGPNIQTFEEALAKIYDKSYIDEETGCYIWEGHYAGDGYGIIQCDGLKQYIHRLIYNKFVCSDPIEVVMHTCDVKRCWNPEHLKGGTHNDNVQDKVTKGRHLIGNQLCNAKLYPEAVLEIRSSSLSPSELGRKFNVSRATIHRVLDGRTWKHVVESTRSGDSLTEIDSDAIQW